ncbi:MAG: hypothetical protein JST00_46870 [Deltaproteobacteria bacterium]|nr:hypothetical protein [Deltaproteobacteria bacterium]
MRRSGAVALVVVVAVGSSASGCKRKKAPKLERVWLASDHGCALEKGAGLACWGKNDAGQLGDGTTQDRAIATRMPGLERPDALALGPRATCGLFGGVVRCWGIEAPRDLPAGVTAIGAARQMICALHASGPRCWGGSTVKPEAIAAQVAFLRGARSFSGSETALCAAFDAPKVVRCTGVGDDGAELLRGADIASLAVGAAHACAALEGGSVTCWGENPFGQLGDGTKTASRAPVTVNGIAGIAAVHAGSNHTCARARNGTTACWGDNRHYQLANGTTEARSMPGAMFGLTGVAELALAGDGSCARTSDGMVKCWGANDVGQLGDGETTDVSVPASIRFGGGDATR